MSTAKTANSGLLRLTAKKYVFSPNTWAGRRIMLVDGHKTELELTRTVEDAGTSSTAETHRTQRRPSEPRFLTVFLAERDRLRRIAAGMGMNGADIDDVLQDVSVQVLKHAGQFEQENEMIRWLIRTTVNRCLMEHRRRFSRRAPGILKRRPDLRQTACRDGDAANQAVVAEELEAVRLALIELDPSLLLVAVLRYFCDLNSKNIGDLLDLNASTVRSRLREARMALAGKLLQRGIQP
jgi:RNA polymerase sigma factor (sigma-70 family)